MEKENNNAEAVAEVIKIDDSNFSVKEEVVTVYSVEEIITRIENIEARIKIHDEQYTKQHNLLVEQLAREQALLQKGIDVGVKEKK